MTPADPRRTPQDWPSIAGDAAAAPSGTCGLPLVALLSGSGAVLALWPHLAQPKHLFAWWLGLALIHCLLQTFSRNLRTHHRERWADDRHWRNDVTVAGAALAGTAWGSLALTGPYHAGHEAQAILFAVLGCVTLAGTGLVPGGRASYAAFAAASLLPLFMLCATTPPASQPYAGLGVVAFALAALAVRCMNATADPGAHAQASGAGPADAQRSRLLHEAGAATLLSRGHRVDSCNRPFAELMRGHERDITGARLLTGFANRAEWRHHVRAAAAALHRGGTYRGTTRLRRCDGSFFWAEITGQTSGAPTPARQIVWFAVDVTDRIRACTHRERHAAQLQVLVDQSSDWYWQTDPRHRLMHVSAHADLADAPVERRLGRSWWQRAPDSPACAGEIELRTAFEQRRGFRRLILEVRDGNKPPAWLSICGMPLHDEHGAFLGHHGTATDVSEQVRSAERFRRLAHHDALTGLPNRRLLADRLTQAIACARRKHRLVGLIMLDLDNFRRLNDLGGHAAGDQALIETADRLLGCVRASDTVARLDSDEFVVVLSELEQATCVDQVAAEILSRLHAPQATQALHRLIGTSIGIALFPHDADCAASLIEVADARMYRAKRRGGHCIERGGSAEHRRPAGARPRP